MVNLITCMDLGHLISYEARRVIDDDFWVLTRVFHAAGNPKTETVPVEVLGTNLTLKEVFARVERIIAEDLCCYCNAPVRDCGPSLWEKDQQCCSKCTH